jgi:adducin
MQRRGVALERIWRRKEALLSPSPPSTVPPPPPLADPPPSTSTTSTSRRPRRRSTYGLQRDYEVLERERKVSSVLESHGFRTELENILQSQLEGKEKPRARPSPDQWQVDLRQSALNPGARKPVAGHGEVSMVLPINDLSGVLSSKYTTAERETRCKLAAVYRLVDMFGWTQLIHNHITVGYKYHRMGYLVSLGKPT